jgi:curved DNA-binding protein CbpA
VRDPFEVLGLDRGAGAEEARRAYRELVRREHPDLHGHETPEEQLARNAAMAEITAAYRMLNDPNELLRWERQEARKRRAAASSSPGRDGVHFTAASPDAGGSVEPAPGDPDFDYRRRARSEFTVDNRQGGDIWMARRTPRRWGSRR